MARRGRKPRPQALKILSNERADRLSADAPKPLEGFPSAPDYLGELGRAEWSRMVEDLQAAGVLSRVDASALGLYCAAYQRWREAEEAVARTGLTASTLTGAEKVSPYVQIANKALETMARLLLEFGATPASRSRVKSTGQAGPADELSDFLRRRKA